MFGISPTARSRTPQAQPASRRSTKRVAAIAMKVSLVCTLRS